MSKILKNTIQTNTSKNNPEIILGIKSKEVISTSLMSDIDKFNDSEDFTTEHKKKLEGLKSKKLTIEDIL